MKPFFIIVFISLAVIGCVSNSSTEKQLTHFIGAYNTQEDLEGLTKQQVIDRFGKPDFTKTSSMYDNRKDIWAYINIYGNIKLTFINGVVIGVEYN